jgi:histidinol-phosphate aminotransferase
MNNVKAPYNVNSLTSEVAINAMGNIATLEKNVATLLEQREVVANALSRLEFVTTVYPSDANFILFRVDKNAKEIYKSMADGGVVTRYRGTEMHCDECIRVTVGTEEENKTFLERLAKTYSDLA